MTLNVISPSNGEMYKKYTCFLDYNFYSVSRYLNLEFSRTRIISIIDDINKSLRVSTKELLHHRDRFTNGVAISLLAFPSKQKFTVATMAGQVKSFLSTVLSLSLFPFLHPCFPVVVPLRTCRNGQALAKSPTDAFVTLLTMMEDREYSRSDTMSFSKPTNPRCVFSPAATVSTRNRRVKLEDISGRVYA